MITSRKVGGDQILEFWIGLDWIGLDWIGLDIVGIDDVDANIMDGTSRMSSVRVRLGCIALVVEIFLAMCKNNRLSFAGKPAAACRFLVIGTSISYR